MSATEHDRGSFSALNDRELEVLRLLAAGHTTTTIATRLGRSETSINERLRAARRKTGIGSSRELARLLEAQKIWDKVTDLSTPSFAVNSLGQPETVGLKRSKGLIGMLIAMAALTLIVAAEPSIQQTAVSQATYAAASR